MYVEVSLDDFPALKAWEERMWARPAVKKGSDVPEVYKFRELLKDPEALERLSNSGRDIVQKGMKEDAEKNAHRTGGASAL